MTHPAFITQSNLKSIASDDWAVMARDAETKGQWKLAEKYYKNAASTVLSITKAIKYKESLLRVKRKAS